MSEKKWLQLNILKYFLFCGIVRFFKSTSQTLLYFLVIWESSYSFPENNYWKILNSQFFLIFKWYFNENINIFDILILIRQRETKYYGLSIPDLIVMVFRVI